MRLLQAIIEWVKSWYAERIWGTLGRYNWGSRSSRAGGNAMDRHRLILDLARIFVGNPWARTGSTLVLIGATAMTGWLAPIVAHLFGFDLKQTDNWIGFALIALGIAMLWHGRTTPEDEKVRDQLKLVGAPVIACRFRRVGTDIMIERAAFQLVLRNDAPLAMDYTINTVTTIFEKRTVPHTEPYPSKGPTLRPGGSSTFTADWTDLANVRCGDRMTGEVRFDISYGVPGKEVWRFRQKQKFEIVLDPNTCNFQRQRCGFILNHWEYIVDR